MKTSKDFFIEHRQREVLDELHEERFPSHLLTAYKQGLTLNEETEKQMQEERESTQFDHQIFERINNPK